MFLKWLVATVLTVYGIETVYKTFTTSTAIYNVAVATVLTVYGIETWDVARVAASLVGCNSTYRLRY